MMLNLYNDYYDVRNNEDYVRNRSRYYNPYLSPEDFEKTSLNKYEIEVYGMIRYWLFFISITCCWLIFPPIRAYRALSYQPHQMMCKLLKTLG